MIKNQIKKVIFVFIFLALIDLSTQSTPQQCYYKSNISCTNRYGQCVSSYSECYNGQSCYYCNKLFEISSGQFYCGDKGDCGLDNYTDFSGLYIFLIVFGSMFVLAVAGFIIFKQYKKRRLRKKVEKIKKIRQLQQEQSMQQAQQQQGFNYWPVQEQFQQQQQGNQFNQFEQNLQQYQQQQYFPPFASEQPLENSKIKENKFYVKNYPTDEGEGADLEQQLITENDREDIIA